MYTLSFFSTLFQLLAHFVKCLNHILPSFNILSYPIHAFLFHCENKNLNLLKAFIISTNKSRFLVICRCQEIGLIPVLFFTCFVKSQDVVNVFIGIEVDHHGVGIGLVHATSDQFSQNTTLKQGTRKQNHFIVRQNVKWPRFEVPSTKLVCKIDTSNRTHCSLRDRLGCRLLNGWYNACHQLKISGGIVFQLPWTPSMSSAFHLVCVLHCQRLII